MKSIITAMLAAASLVTVASAEDTVISTDAISYDGTTIPSTVDSSNHYFQWDDSVVSSSLSSWAVTFTFSSTSSSGTGPLISLGTNTQGTGAGGLTVVYNRANGTLQLGSGNSAISTDTLAITTGATYVFAYSADLDTAYIGNTSDGTYISFSMADYSITTTLVSGTARQWSNSAADTTTVYTVSDISSIAGNTTAIVNLVTTGSAVPEPATATLSLLALAGLAARRRRK